MRERLRLFGGSLALHSRHMEGTEILAEVPLAQVNRAGTAPVATTQGRIAKVKGTHFTGKRPRSGC